jgi:hypothetical protein
MENPIKNFFGTDKASTNPDANKSKMVMYAAITIGALFVIRLVIRGLTSSSAQKPSPTSQIKLNAAEKQAYTNKAEAIPSDNVSLRDNPEVTVNNNQQDIFAGSQEANPNVNAQAAAAPGQHQAQEPNRVNSILSRVSASSGMAQASEDYSSPQEGPRMINPYPYIYAAGDKPEGSYLSPYWRRVLSPDLKQIREYTGGEMIVYDDSKNQKTDKQERQISQAEVRTNPAAVKSGLFYPAGTVFKAVTLDRINSDFPSTVRGKITSPAELAGSIILLSTTQQNNNRISIKPAKLIYQDKSTELNGFIRADLPGLSGSINRHIARKTLNPLAAAGLIAYGTVFGNRNANQINTEDAIRASIIQEGINLGANELQKYSGDVPNTVDARVGTYFEVLLVDDLKL